MCIRAQCIISSLKEKLCVGECVISVYISTRDHFPLALLELNVTALFQSGRHSHYNQAALYWGQIDFGQSFLVWDFFFSIELIMSQQIQLFSVWNNHLFNANDNSWNIEQGSWNWMFILIKSERYRNGPFSSRQSRWLKDLGDWCVND